MNLCLIVETVLVSLFRSACNFTAFLCKNVQWQETDCKCADFSVRCNKKNRTGPRTRVQKIFIAVSLSLSLFLFFPG